MCEIKIYQELRKKFVGEFSIVSKQLDLLSKLYRNVPLSETDKKSIVDARLKEKSAWYACLINSNIDILLIPEYLESKLSRNILIKKETEQYFKSIEQFNLHTVQSQKTIFESILYNEEAKPKSSVDLFSSQAPESATCPEALQNLFESWVEKFEGCSELEMLIFSIHDWHDLNLKKFSSQRQFTLWINYNLWKEYGHIALGFEIENFFYKNWNNETTDNSKLILDLLEFLQNETIKHTEILKDEYRNSIRFESFKSRQKLVSNFIFESGFDLAFNKNDSNEAIRLMKLIQEKGFICRSDFEKEEDLEKCKQLLIDLTERSYLLIDGEENEISIYLNTGIEGNKGRLASYQNISPLKNEANIESFINQSANRPIVQLETYVIPEQSVEVPLKEKRKKAFFG